MLSKRVSVLAVGLGAIVLASTLSLDSGHAAPARSPSSPSSPAFYASLPVDLAFGGPWHYVGSAPHLAGPHTNRLPIDWLGTGLIDQPAPPTAP